MPATPLAVLLTPDRLAAALPPDGDTVTVAYLPQSATGMVTVLMLGDAPVYGFDESRSVKGDYAATLPRAALADAITRVCAVGAEIVLSVDGDTLVLASGDVTAAVSPAPAVVVAPEPTPAPPTDRAARMIEILDQLATCARLRRELRALCATEEFYNVLVDTYGL